MMTASYSPGSVPHVLAKSEPVSTNLQRSIRSNSALNDAVRSRLWKNCRCRASTANVAANCVRL